MNIHISKRLRAVVSHVPPNARVIDVGTDHGIVPVWLVQNGIASHVWASDVREGPLSAAARLLRENAAPGDKIQLRLTDGLHGFSHADGDTVILAGMGGETIIAILSEAAWTKNDVLLILQPQSKQAELRRWLFGNGYCIDCEQLVEDAGRLYPIFTARGGTQEHAYTDAECLSGPVSALSDDPCFPRWVDGLLSRVGDAAPYDEQAQRLYSELKAIKEKWR